LSKDFHNAASDNDIKAVAEFLNNGIDINYFDKSGPGRTALIEAAIYGNLETVSLLINKGAYINCQCRAMGFTPLAWACYKGHHEIAQILINAGADLNLPSSMFHLSPLIVAANNGHEKVVDLLIKSGADIHAQTADGENALTKAQKIKHINIISILKEHGLKEPIPKEELYLDWPEIGDDFSKVDYENAVSVLRFFILSMYRWEKEAYENYTQNKQKFDFDKAIVAKQLACTEKKRTYESRGISSSPEYTPGEVLVSVNTPRPNRIEIITRTEKNNSFRYENLYIMLKKKGRFLIDSKKNRPYGVIEWSKTLL